MIVYIGLRLSDTLQPSPIVAIVGGGASGTLTAIHLLRRTRRPLEVVLIERRAEPGRGVAYSTPVEAHLLNVRAGSMSALPDEPLHFVDWLHQTETGEPWRSALPTDFVPRHVYGDYLKATMRAAQTSARPGVQLAVRLSDVVAIDGGERMRVELRDGTPLTADRCVLALGNFAPHPLRAAGNGVAQDPWSPTALDGLVPRATVLLVGTGLTMIDVLVSLVERGHKGPIIAISRRGVLPQVHADPHGYAHAWPASEVPETALGLLRGVRREIRLAAQGGHDWRGVVDSLRPVTQAVWQRASLAERARFLRHVQPFWDSHRHRIAPSIGHLVAETRASGQLSVRAGRIVSIEPASDGVQVEVEVAARRGGRWSVRVARVINCTGPAVDAERIADPLLRSLLASGLVRADALHLGLATTIDGRLVEADGAASQRVFGLGPMRRGELWETTAVPDIRVQAARLAEVLVAELGVG